MRKSSALILGVAFVVGAAVIGRAASLPNPFMTGPQDPSQLQADINSLAASVNQYTSGYQPHNFLDNGAFLVNQRGTGIATGGTTSGPGVTAYASDRWAIECNVTSCAPRGAIVTSATGVTFAPGIGNMLSVYRNSGALTQPIVAEQFIKSANFTQLAGKPVIMSCYIAKNAGAASAATATMYLWTGTGTDEGLGSLRSAVGMTASPALTPALTGVATAGSFTTAALTTTVTRYSSGQIAVPSTATEGIFAVGFTPGAETAGTTDGILVGNCQLELADPAQTTAGRFENRAYGAEYALAQRYYVQWADNLANTFTLPGTCTETTANTSASCTLHLPATQDLAAPVAAVATATSFGMTKTADGTAEACSTLAVVASSNNPNSINLTCAASETAAVGTMHLMLYANTGATKTITVSSDF